MAGLETSASTWVVVAATVVVLVGLTVVLLRQGSPGRLSERQNQEQLSSGSRHLDVADRPAGPDAEAMGAAAGHPSTVPEPESTTAEPGRPSTGVGGDVDTQPPDRG